MPSDNHLFEALKRGDPAAFNDIVKTCYRRCASAVLRNGGSDADAEDLFQEALFVLVKKLREPSFEIHAQPCTYLYGIVRNLWLKKLRDRGGELPTDEATLLRLRHDDSLEDWRLLEQAAERQARFAHVVKALDKMGEDCRQIILRSYMENQSDKEIAADMSYQLPFVKVKRFRCMSKLRELLGGR